MGTGEHRKDLDQTVIRFAGRDYTAANLVQGALWIGLGGVVCLVALAVGQPWVWLVAGVLVVIGLGTAIGR